MRDNEVLDEAFNEIPSKKRRRKRRPGLSADQVRRLAYRVLNLISGLDGPARRRVLREAARIVGAFKSEKPTEPKP